MKLQECVFRFATLQTSCHTLFFQWKNEKIIRARQKYCSKRVPFLGCSLPFRGYKNSKNSLKLSLHQTLKKWSKKMGASDRFKVRATLTACFFLTDDLRNSEGFDRSLPKTEAFGWFGHMENEQLWSVQIGQENPIKQLGPPVNVLARPSYDVSRTYQIVCKRTELVSTLVLYNFSVHICSRVQP